MNGNPASDAPTGQPSEQGWQALLEDMAATADAYRERGWTTLELHPGDSVLLDTEQRTGLDVLLPGDEYEELESRAEDVAFSDVDVFQAAAGGTTYLLVVEKDPDSETAVFVPAYYDDAAAAAELETIRANGELRLFCRRLDDDYVEFVHDDVDPFLPDDARSD